MNRKTTLFQKRVQYMVILMLVFLGVFAAFCLTVYKRSSSALYKEIDRDFTYASTMIRAHTASSLENFLAGRNIVYTGSGSYLISYRIYIVMRDDAGRILNAAHLSPFDYLYNLPFLPTQTYTTINNNLPHNGQMLVYRTYTLPIVSETGTQYYIQLTTDATDIAESLNIIRDVLIMGMCVVLFISLAASWFVVHLLVKAMTDAWDKQDQFISFASHELRSPLAVIHSSLELLLQKPGARIIESSELILQALSATARMRRMTSDMLSMDSLQSSQRSIGRDEFFLDELIDELVTPYFYQPEAADKQLELDLLSGQVLCADRQLIGRLVGILLENAIKYTNPGDKIHIATRGGDNQVTLSVRDTGIGISDAAMARVFTRFYRENRTTKDGSGLGLYIASLIVTRHKGKIRVLHNQPCGTEFLVTLPPNG